MESWAKPCFGLGDHGPPSFFKNLTSPYIYLHKIFNNEPQNIHTCPPLPKKLQINPKNTSYGSNWATEISCKQSNLAIWNKKMMDLNRFVVDTTADGEIIIYFRSTINMYSLIPHEWWVTLIKFMVRPTIHVREETHVREGTAHLWYSEST